MPSLTQHDIFVLEKINDPEASPEAPLLIDSSLPKDPNVLENALYQKVSSLERSIIASIQEIELQIAGLKPLTSQAPPLSRYLICVQSLDGLIQEYPKYASARNNRAQALRRIYGDGILVKSIEAAGIEEAVPLDTSASEEQLVDISSTILTDLSTAISILTPRTPYMPLSPQSVKTLSQAHTQRGAFYHLNAKRLSLKGAELRIDSSREEAGWRTVDFEEHASRDFMMGGRYGNEIAKALAVSANPTAKLCGEMVREAMRKEYAGGQVL
ncbi:hypothetical protein BGZ60DRAFT_429734 [Tricladium varicosporioides]|nr:hypothetical protein BGZ60DRAFT_429734 [Hymenoscyphus varicosporioides]